MIHSRRKEKPTMFNRIILDEYRRCASDLRYFMSTCLKLSSQDDKVLPLLESQEVALGGLQEFKKALVRTPRQCGFSTLAHSLVLHEALFNYNHHTTIVVPNSAMAYFVSSNLQRLYDSLPTWIESELHRVNRFELHFKNESSIRIITAGTPSKGLTHDTLYLADIGVLSRQTAEMALYSLLPSCKPDSRIIVNSEDGFHGLESNRQFGLISL